MIILIASYFICCHWQDNKEGGIAPVKNYKTAHGHPQRSSFMTGPDWIKFKKRK